MDIKKMDEKIAENVREIAELELGKQKRREADKEAIESDKRRAEVKLQTQLDHDDYLKEKQRQQDLKNEAKTPEAKTRESYRHAREIRDRRISKGVTKDERAYMDMDSKTRRDCDNAIAQGDAKNVRDFLKKKQQEQEASERRRRKLKGL